MHLNELHETIEILLVEDSDCDAMLVTHALKKARVRTRLHRVADGMEAIAFLRQQGSHSAAPRPHLILLDLNLPKKTGREVLNDVKTDESLKTIPVVILTSSSAVKDILEMYAHHANCYITKPAECEGFSLVIQSIENFWFSIATLPPHTLRGGR